MKFIKGMTQVIFDETLSSWVFRSSLKLRSRPRVNVDSIPSAPLVSWGGALLEYDDWDFSPDAVLLHKAIPDLANRLEKLKCNFFQMSGRVVGWHRRWWFCVQCMREDVTAGQAPSWRKSWCYKDAIVCKIHCVDLQKLLVTPRLTRSWDAFVQSVHPIRHDADWADINFQRFRVNLIRRIVRWKKAESESLQTIFDNLYDIFLLAPTYSGNHGQAHDLFGTDHLAIRCTLANYVEGVKYGSELSDNKSRFGSLVLAGYLMGQVSVKDINFMRSKCAKFKSWCDYNPDISLAIQFGCASVEDCYILKTFLGGLELLPGGNLEKAVRAYLVKFERFRPGISADFFTDAAL